MKEKLEDENHETEAEEHPAPETGQKSEALRPNTYWLTRIVLLRSLTFVYFVAFLIALFQNKALIGSHGILPADQCLTRSVHGNVFRKTTKSLQKDMILVSG